MIPHQPVLLNEMLQYLSPQDNEHYLDCTFGAGGYTNAILNHKDCSVTALDQDPNLVEFVNQTKNNAKNKFHFIQTNFSDILDVIDPKIKFHGVVLDLGVSSMQLDNASRGFSFMHDGPLDMRMNSSGISAAELIHSVEEENLADIIYQYGDEVQSRSIAKNIVAQRKIAPITSTLQLAQIIRDAMHFRHGKIDPATKTFQAIRIYINQELKMLQTFLNNVQHIMLSNAKLIVVSFHSLEDIIVKQFFKNHSLPKIAKSKYAKNTSQDAAVDLDKYWLEIITKKPISPSKAEVMNNPRARSGKLRVAQKI